MFCKNCGSELQEGAAFCPYCGEKQGVEPQPQPQSEQPVYQQAPPQQNYYQPANESYYAPQGAPENEVSSARSLGLASLIGGIFIPLVGWICGGIGLSKVSQLKLTANEQQQAVLAKAKKLCIAGIIVPIVLSLIWTIVITVVGVKAAKYAYDEFENGNYYSYDYDDADEYVDEYIDEYVDDFFDQYD